MKIAVVLTGHLRCWKQVFPNFQDRIINRYNPDIFIHTWNEEGWWIPGDKTNVKGFHESTPSVFEDEIREAYKPKRLVVEDWEKYNNHFETLGETYPNFAHRRKNILSMFYKLQKGISLVEEYSAKHNITYDFVIRMRPDLILNENLPDFDTNSFYTMVHRNHLGQGTGDMFQASNFFNMILFSKLPCFMHHVYSQTDILCPHLLSETWIKNLKLNWKEFYVNKTIQHTPQGEYKEMS
jgi:hypothetical protein